MTPQTKHGPNRFSSYQQIHTTVMQQLVREGFVLSDELQFRDMGYGAIVLEGEIPCAGGITVSVRKVLKLRIASGREAEVQATEYSYNAVLDGVGTILRYDSPHQSHNKYHHVHRHLVFERDHGGKVEEIHKEEDRPTLGEVLSELRDWYYENIDAITTIERRP